MLEFAITEVRVHFELSDEMKSGERELGKFGVMFALGRISWRGSIHASTHSMSYVQEMSFLMLRRKYGKRDFSKSFPGFWRGCWSRKKKSRGIWKNLMLNYVVLNATLTVYHKCPCAGAQTEKNLKTFINIYINFRYFLSIRQTASFSSRKSSVLNRKIVMFYFSHATFFTCSGVDKSLSIVKIFKVISPWI